MSELTPEKNDSPICGRCDEPGHDSVRHSITCWMADIIPLPFSPYHPSNVECSHRILNGPLDDISVLVQIPKVHELVLELRCAYQGDTSGRKIMQPWFDALEATS